MNITIGITTYSRPDLLRSMSASLLECSGISSCSIRIYDDASPFWDSQFLSAVFPSAKSITRRERNLGADGNMCRMFSDFLETGDDVLLIADSDLIFRPDMICCIEETISESDGILSMYNSAVHTSHDRCSISGVPFVIKKSIGAAGTVLTRDIVRLIVDNVPPSRSWDWDWSRFLVSRGKRIYVAEESYIQHIGVHGQNSSSFLTEYGLNFYPGTRHNERALADFFQQVIRRKDEVIRSYRVFKPVMYPRRSALIVAGRIRMLIRKFIGR